MAGGDVSLWRIAKHTVDYSATDLGGGGARATGGRWNGKGIPVVYAASTIALATLETLAHLGDNIAIRNAFLVRIDVPASVWKAREMITAAGLAPTWLAERRSPLLLVPSVIVPEEYNVLINPLHALAKKLNAQVVRQYVYDPRL